MATRNSLDGTDERSRLRRAVVLIRGTTRPGRAGDFTESGMPVSDDVKARRESNVTRYAAMIAAGRRIFEPGRCGKAGRG